ncbi:hypothetical protein GQ53DRAFT_814208 [Thozetella sp. PMI_491]|nr:hypothetical protein GQ53DRAFT_814208 [Thozetella sp. PMI_491]
MGFPARDYSGRACAGGGWPPSEPGSGGWSRRTTGCEGGSPKGPCSCWPSWPRRPRSWPRGREPSCQVGRDGGCDRLHSYLVCFLFSVCPFLNPICTPLIPKYSYPIYAPHVTVVDGCSSSELVARRAKQGQASTITKPGRSSSLRAVRTDC